MNKYRYLTKCTNDEYEYNLSDKELYDLAYKEDGTSIEILRRIYNKGKEDGHKESLCRSLHKDCESCEAHIREDVYKECLEIACNAIGDAKKKNIEVSLGKPIREDEL